MYFTCPAIDLPPPIFLVVVMDAFYGADSSSKGTAKDTIRLAINFSLFNIGPEDAAQSTLRQVFI